MLIGMEKSLLNFGDIPDSRGNWTLDVLKITIEEQTT